MPGCFEQRLCNDGTTPRGSRRLAISPHAEIHQVRAMHFIEESIRDRSVWPMDCERSHSHSIVAGGFPEMSYVTREIPFTSLQMRRATRSKNSYGRRDQRAVMK